MRENRFEEKDGMTVEPVRTGKMHRPVNVEGPDRVIETGGPENVWISEATSICDGRFVV